MCRVLPGLLALALGFFPLTGCRRGVGWYEVARPAGPGPVPPPGLGPEHQDSPRILSARVESYDDPGAGHLDRLTLVFSEPLDVMGVVPASFLVANARGQIVEVNRATIWPANEHDELHTVWLHLELGTPGDPAPLNVGVVGHLHTLEGTDLRGATATIAPMGEGLMLVHAMALEVSQECPEGTHGIRTFWSGIVEPARDLSGVEIASAGGSKGATHLGDVDGDNVLDFCFSAVVDGAQLRVKKGSVRDAAGNPARSGAIRLQER